MAEAYTLAAHIHFDGAPQKSSLLLGSGVLCCHEGPFPAAIALLRPPPLLLAVLRTCALAWCSAVLQPPTHWARRSTCALVAPFEIPSSFRHSAAPSDSTILQDQRENHHTSLAGSIMMIADAALLKARAADVSCAQLGSATRARDTVRSPGRCSFNDMHLFSTPLYITRQAAVCASNHYTTYYVLPCHLYNQ